MQTSSVRVLLVEDSKPFRQMICSILENRPELQIVGELSDGLEAVKGAEELQPDLILLDIGLPRLNGIEAAQRIQRLAPKSKILFVSQESSADLVQKALSLGARGYVVKMDAGRELLAAIDAVLRGEQFVGGRFAGHNFSRVSETAPLAKVPSILEVKQFNRSSAARRHEAGFYSDHDRLLDGFSQFIATALKGGKAVIVVATESDRDSFFLRLQGYGVDIGTVIESGRYISLDADDTLSAIMVNGSPDPVHFMNCVGDLIGRVANAVNGEHGRVAACGICAPLLCEAGNMEAAIRVEHLCDEVATTHKVEILCGYSLATFQGGLGNHVFERICAAHSAVHSW